MEVILELQVVEMMAKVVMVKVMVMVPAMAKVTV